MSGELERRAEDAIEISPGAFMEVLEGEDTPPEFVIVGTRQPGGGVALFVSNQVTEAKFARQLDGYDELRTGAGRPARIPRITAVVGVKMLSFEQILGDDYLSALRTLLEHQAAQQAIRSRYPRTVVQLPESHDEPQP